MNLKPIRANMTELQISGARILFSYETPVAAVTLGNVYRTEKRWSNTTTRHINQWLDGMQATTKPQEFFDSLAAAVK